MAFTTAIISPAITPTPSSSSQSTSIQKRARLSVHPASGMAITAPLNTTSPSSSFSSQNPSTLNFIANPAIFSPDIRPTFLSSAIPPSTEQKLKEKIVKTLLKGIPR